MAELGPGAHVGRYQLVAPIGVGGMGRVWVALDTAAPALRLVALKTALTGSGSPDRDFWAMLSDEASLASRIQHPNVCSTYELGEDKGVHFLVMEWSNGASLRDVLDAAPAKRMAPELAAFIGAGVAGGLHAAHELTDDAGHSLGVVHRDVSPQNILVSLQGQVRLADFGVAKARGQQHRPTETGEVKGKLSYMAPEQVASKNIDRRADVFALGCVLYEATLGVRPFHGADALATMYKILEEELVPPRSIDPNFPEQLEVVLLRALQKQPDARFASAEDLRVALVEFLSATKRVLTSKHVAETLTGSLGDQLRERNREILSRAERLRSGESLPALGTDVKVDSSRAHTPQGGIERSITASKRPRTKRWSGSTVLIVGAGLLGAALVVRSMWRGEPTPMTAPKPSANEVALSAKAAATVPPDNPVENKLGSAAVAETSLPEAPRPVVRGSRGGRQPVPARSATAAASVSQPVVRKPRPIDTENPFANP